MSYDLWSRLRYMLSPQFDIYEQVAKTVSGLVADIGCGTGFGTHLLSRNADYVTGYEVDDAAMRFADRTFSNGKVNFHSANITEGVWLQHGFDYVVMIDVIEHINQDAVAIANSKELLNANGTFIISTPNRVSRYRKSDYHVREYSPDELKELLSSVFDNVGMVDFELKPMESKYTNPILAVCQ